MSGENPPEQRLSGKLPASLLERFDKQLKFPVPKQKPKILPKPVIPSNRITQVPTETTMSDNSIFHSPMILVLTVDGKATCNQSTLDKLREIEKPLNIVSVVGTLRTGKSFILNKLARHDSAGDKSWFETGHTMTAVTKGIWVMCRPHPTQDDQVLVLLDTEGIDDPKKINIEDDKNLFVLAALLSSTMVYNTRGDFDKTAIDKSGDKSWFETGHTMTAVTKGIWVMCRPHPTQDDQVLVLLDTEGIDDPKKINIEDDKNLFVLAALLSSTMVYNTRGDFDKTAIDKFKFLNRIKTSIKVSGSQEDDSILDFFFPNFVLTLRDVTLDISHEDDDTYLEETLNLERPKEGENITENCLEEYNLPRILLRRYFKNRKCFRFKRPAKDKLLKELMTLPEKDLKTGFQKTLNEFRKYIYSCEPKLLKSGKAINGRMFSTLLLNYVHSIQVGESPCLTTAMISMSTAENTHVVEKASESYKREMKTRLASHSPSEKGLVNHHKDSMKAALEVLKSGLIIDDKQIYEQQAMVCFRNQFEKFKNIVKNDLEAKCLHTLGRLDTTKIQVKIKNRKYCTPTGYDDYMKDLDLLMQQFNREAGYMGSVARIVLEEFLEKKVEEEEIVYKMVLEALDGQEGPARRKIKRLRLFGEEDEVEEEVEEAIRADIEMLQVNGLQNIGTKYLGILKTKIEEVARVKKELTRSNSYYHQLCNETAHLKNIFEKSAFNLFNYRKQLKSVTERKGTDIQSTAYNEPWEDEIRPLWKKALEKDESIDEENVTSQCSFVGEGFKQAKKESTRGDGLTVLPDKYSLETMSDEAPVEEQNQNYTCNII